jgi:hypothetical protein
MINPLELEKDDWLITATGKYARVIAVDLITMRVEVTVHDTLVSAIKLIDGSNTLDMPISALRVWQRVKF